MGRLETRFVVRFELKTHKRKHGLATTQNFNLEGAIFTSDLHTISV